MFFNAIELVNANSQLIFYYSTSNKIVMYYQLVSNLNMLSLATAMTADSGCTRLKKLTLFIILFYFILLHLNFIYIII